MKSTQDYAFNRLFDLESPAHVTVPRALLYLTLTAFRLLGFLWP